MKKILTFVLTAVFIISAMAFVGCAPTEDKKDTLSISNNFKTEFVNTTFVSVEATTPMTYSETESSVSQELKAVVYPSTAKNKEVVWSIKWEQEKASDVTDFVTVTPSSTSSLQATVTCYKAFEGNIIITVTTKEGGYSADCYVSFVGIPTEIAIDTTVIGDGETYKVGVNQNYVFNVFANNPFNQVGLDYQDLEVSLYGVGTITLGDCSYFPQTNTTQWSASLQTVDLNSVLDKFMAMTYEDGVVTITTTSKVLNEDYYESVQSVDGGRQKNYVNKIKEISSDCSFVLKITEPKTGVSREVELVTDETVVTSVSVAALLTF